jgi:hypothetical protein
MKFYSIVIHNQKIIRIQNHSSKEDAFNTLENLYEFIFDTDLKSDSNAYDSLIANNVLYEDLNHDNHYTFQIIEKTLN